MSLVIDSPISGTTLTYGPPFWVEVEGWAPPGTGPVQLTISSVNPDAEPSGWFWSDAVEVTPDASGGFTHLFDNIPYATEYRIRASALNQLAQSFFKFRREVEVQVPETPGAELIPYREGGNTLVDVVVAANVGDTIRVAMPSALPSYNSTPPGLGSVHYAPLASSWFYVRADATYLMEVWLKADRPGSRLTIEWDPRGGYGEMKATGTAGDETPGAPGNYIVNNLELPTEWTKYRAHVTWRRGTATSPSLNSVPGWFHFNQDTGSERGAVQSIAGLRMVPLDPSERNQYLPSIPGDPEAWFYLESNRIPYGDTHFLYPPELEYRTDDLPLDSKRWLLMSSGGNLDPRLFYRAVIPLQIPGAGSYPLHVWTGQGSSVTSGPIQTSFTTAPLGLSEPPTTPELHVLSGAGSIAGDPNNLAGYSVVEEAPPSNFADLSGGIPSITVDAPANDDTELLMHHRVELSDAIYGLVSGDVTGVEVSESGIATITADSPLRRLVRTVKIQPTSYEEFRIYLQGLLMEAGFPAEKISITAAPGRLDSLYPGGERDLWEWLKELLTLNRLEIVMVGDVVQIRDRRGPQALYLGQDRGASLSDPEALIRSTTQGDAAREVSVTYHEAEQVGEWVVNPRAIYNWGHLYPAGGWHEDVKILQVDAGETQEEELDTNGSFFSVFQPDCVTWVDREGPFHTSVYAVSGNDGLPIPPAMWLDYGGDLSVRISDDSRSIIATLTGANLPDLAPFQVAMSAGPSDRYSSLRLTGTGINLTEKTLTIPTGVAEEHVFTEEAPSIDSELLTNLEDAYTVAVAAAKWHSGAVMEVSGFEPDLWRWFGSRYQRRDPFLGGQVDQAFGNMAGSRFRTGRRVWRVQSVNTSPSGSEFTALEDTTFRDFQHGFVMFLDTDGAYGRTPSSVAPHGGWEGNTFADVNAVYAGMTFSDFTTRPLQADPS